MITFQEVAQVLHPSAPTPSRVFSGRQRRSGAGGSEAGIEGAQTRVQQDRAFCTIVCLPARKAYR